MSHKTVAIIPARGNSKRCPNKNTALFKNKPLIAHTIEQALESKVFDEILVTTDDPKVIEIASQYQQFNLKIDNREPSLATDKATLIDVIRHLIYTGEYQECLVGLLLVTAPLRTIEDIQQSYQIFCSSNKQHSVVSVTLNESPIQLSWFIKEDHLENFFDDTINSSTRKQDYESTYRYNDAIIFDLGKNFLNPERNLFGINPIPYVMPPERSIYVDYEFQLRLIQMIGDFQTSVP